MEEKQTKKKKKSVTALVRSTRSNVPVMKLLRYAVHYLPNCDDYYSPYVLLPIFDTLIYKHIVIQVTRSTCQDHIRRPPSFVRSFTKTMRLFRNIHSTGMQLVTECRCPMYIQVTMQL